jgi:tryptophanyl-tRNA synthetase
MAKPIILSGMQPTGSLHIGNYLGALKNWVELQNSNKYETYFFIADLHSLTIAMEPKTRRENIRLLAAEFIAAGIDPNKSTIFVQSYIQEHAELAWIFDSVTPVSELERMTQYKDKSAKNEKNINAGLLTYPVLQAADVLLYHTSQVPVGKDQEQHLELTNMVARKFNNAYGDYFKEIKPLFTEIPKVMSLMEPEKKMSKSMGDAHYIGISDEPKDIENKLKKAVTATSGGGKAPGVENLLTLLKQFGDEKIYKQFVAAEKDKSIRYGDLKQALSEAIAAHFADFRARRSELLANPKKLDEILESGNSKARAVATKTMADVRQRVGLR